MHGNRYMSSNNQDELRYRVPLDKQEDEDKSMNRSNSEANMGNWRGGEEVKQHRDIKEYLIKKNQISFLYYINET